MKACRTVLIVDDEKIICELLVTYLQQRGYETRAVHSGEEALEALKTQSFDVVITDLYMPGISGFEVIRYVNDFFPETVLLMITGSACQNDRATALECGADEFLLKPVVLGDLLRHLPPPLVNPV
jgi:CheY-like chemotaxis protein